jgi:hypothetical protein
MAEVSVGRSRDVVSFCSFSPCGWEARLRVDVLSNSLRTFIPHVFAILEGTRKYFFAIT